MRIRTLLSTLQLILAPATWAESNPKQEQLTQYTRDDNNKPLTTDFGVRVNDTDNSLKAGIRGPTLMEDFQFREKITRFDHERIPERVVHARGHGAYGVFESYKDWSHLTSANFLSAPGKKTPVFVRFSTVLGSRGSADTVRDIRGFATKFYTEEGNFDIVGNDIPVFFVQDAIKFLDLIHAAKPEQDTEIPQAASAHDNFYDFVTLAPETLHTVLWTHSPRGIPRSVRHIQGFGVHTFRLVDANGGSRFVKFHWTPLNGVTYTVWDESQKLAGKNPDWQRQDLYEAINRGDFPEYELGIQIVDEKDEFAFDFDLLDATKIIPESLVPVTPIGKMTLTKNPDNFFSEVEQVAFCTSHIVPGIDFTNDPLLQGRTFSYFDTQLNRFQSPNWEYLPVNQPIVEVHNNHRDGFMQPLIFKGPAAYYPHSRYGAADPVPSDGKGGNHFKSYPEKIDGHKIRARSPSFNDHFSQSQLFYNSLSNWERHALHSASIFELLKVKSITIRQRWVDLINNVDSTYAEIVAKAIGVNVPEPKKNEGRKTKGVSIEEYPVKSVKGMKVAVVCTGCGECDTSGVKGELESKGVLVEVVQKRLEDGVTKTFVDADSVFYDGIILPSTSTSDKCPPDAPFTDNEDALSFIRDTYRHLKPMGVIGNAIDVVKEAIRPSTLEGSYGDGVFVGDGFVGNFMEGLLKGRFWGRVLKE